MAVELGLCCCLLLIFFINFSSNYNSKTVYCKNESRDINGCYKCHLFETFTDHGNHTEDSPFLSTDAAGKKNEFYDRNLALFEVCLFLNFSYLLLTEDGTKPIH